MIAVDVCSSEPDLIALEPEFLSRTEPRQKGLQIILRAGVTRGIPVIIGRWRSWRKLPFEPAAEKSSEMLQENAASVFAKINSKIYKHMVEVARDPGRISSCGSSPNLRKRDLTESAHIVALLGCRADHPCLQAYVVLAGCAHNAAVFATFPAMHGFDLGLAVPTNCQALAAFLIWRTLVRVSGGRHFGTLMLVSSPKTLNKWERRTILLWFGHMDVMRSLVPPNDTRSRSPRGGYGRRGGSRHD